MRRRTVSDANLLGSTSPEAIAINLTLFHAEREL
jgi:hypothetical protein